MTHGDALAPEISSWILETTGATDLRVERRSAGASRAGYAVDAILPSGEVKELWLRIDIGVGPQSSGTYTVRREAAVYRALHGRGVAIAEVVAVHPTEEAFLMGRLTGRNWFSEIVDPEQQAAVAVAFMRELAALHHVDVRELDLPELGPVRSVREHVLDEIDTWEAQYRAQRDSYPPYELALTWLRANVPDDDTDRVVLVQGDTGPGNFMYDGDRIVAVTDWEMAHFGDPHDDLAWIYVRDVQERFTDLRERLRDYERFSGHQVDPARLRYFLVLAQTRCAIGTRNGLLARDSRTEMANHLIYSTLHDRLLIEALAGAFGVDLSTLPPVPDAPDSPAAWAFDVALDDLRDVVVPAVHDGFALRRAKGIARLLKYLRGEQRLGAAARAAERDGLAQLLGGPVDDAAVARDEVCRRISLGELDQRAVLRHCAATQAWANEIARGAMGTLADRHHQPLPD